MNGKYSEDFKGANILEREISFLFFLSLVVVVRLGFELRALHFTT
jgi:hypothetical protein